MVVAVGFVADDAQLALRDPLGFEEIAGVGGGAVSGVARRAMLGSLQRNVALAGIAPVGDEDAQRVLLRGREPAAVRRELHLERGRAHRDGVVLGRRHGISYDRLTGGAAA